MYVNAKKLAFLGLLLAGTTLLVIFSGIWEFNTLFLLAGASFAVGIAIRECKLRIGFGFYIASVLLSFILAPNKIYCITYSAMGLYLVVIEYFFLKLSNINWKKNLTILFWVIKYVTFNLMYIPILLCLPKLIYQGQINTGFLVVFILVGQIALFIYDTAHNYFQKNIWEKVRKNLNL
jgi:hypothetical protein